MLDGRDRAHVRNGGDSVNRGGLIRNGDRGVARDRYDLAALDVFGRALLRRADQYREEQRREQSMDDQRGEEAARESLPITAVPRIALERHGPS
jgi:hypothetical protein